MHYKISDNISFLQPKGAVKSALSKLYTNVDEHIIVKNRADEREFVVNNTVKSFIEKFSCPKTLIEVTEEIAAEVNASTDVTAKIVAPFFKYMLHRKFIIPELKQVKKIQSKRLLRSNTIINGFRIKEAIDISERLDIYKAVDTISKQEIVIKLLKQPENKYVQELQREYNFLKTLQHTNVSPKVYGFTETKDTVYFVQQFIKGTRLPLYFEEKKSVKAKDVTRLAFEIIKAFKKIHAKGIVHGDIHPSNIIVTNKDKIKVIDFGLSLNHEDNNKRVNFGGAYSYMPPERITKTTAKKFLRKPDFYSDVYQLGIIIYTLLYNELPFDGLTWEQLAKEIKHKKMLFAPTSYYGFEVPDWIKDFISKCTAKKPLQRFTDAQEMYVTFLKTKSHGN